MPLFQCQRPALPRPHLRPLLDRIDIHVEVPAVQYRDISSNVPGEASESIRERVKVAREVQRARFSKNGKTRCNSRMTAQLLKKHCQLDDAAEGMMKMAMTELNFSARAYDRILKVARTIADLAGAEHIQAIMSVRRSNTAHWTGICGRKSYIILKRAPPPERWRTTRLGSPYTYPTHREEESKPPRITDMTTTVETNTSPDGTRTRSPMYAARSKPFSPNRQAGIVAITEVTRKPKTIAAPNCPPSGSIAKHITQACRGKLWVKNCNRIGRVITCSL